MQIDLLNNAVWVQLYQRGRYYHHHYQFCESYRFVNEVGIIVIIVVIIIIIIIVVIVHSDFEPCSMDTALPGRQLSSSSSLSSIL